MSRAAYYRSVDTDPAGTGRADLRLVPVALAAYAAAWFGDSADASVGGVVTIAWGACAVVGVVLLATDPNCARSSRSVQRPRSAGPRRTLAAMLIVGAGVGVAATARVTVLHTGPLPALAASRARATVEFVVTDDPRTIPSKRPGQGPLTIVPARAELVTPAGSPDSTSYQVRSPITVMASASSARANPWHGLLPSTRVRTTGRLGPAGDGWPDAAILSTRLAPETVLGPTLVQRFAGRLRQGLRDACAHLPPDERGLIPGLVIGDVSEEPASLAEAFQATGLTHLTAVSGENLVFVIGATMPLAGLAGVRGRPLTILGMATVVGFTVLARPEPSMVRASVMSLLALAVVASGRRARGVPVLCAGTLVLLLANPWLARSYGFALSLSATAGLFVLAPGLQDRLMRRRVPHRIAESLACTAAAETFCLPILVSLTATITPLSLPANLLAEFCVGPATVLGAAALAASAVWLPLGRACAWLAQWPTRGLVSVARYGSQLPFASIHWPRGAVGTATLLAVYVAFATLVMTAAAVASRRGRGVR